MAVTPNAYITKPIDAADFTRVVRQITTFDCALTHRTARTRLHPTVGEDVPAEQCHHSARGAPVRHGRHTSAHQHGISPAQQPFWRRRGRRTGLTRVVLTAESLRSEAVRYNAWGSRHMGP